MKRLESRVWCLPNDRPIDLSLPHYPEAWWLSLIHISLFRKDWVVYSKPPFGGPEYVLQYLGRYTHRVAISNLSLIHI